MIDAYFKPVVDLSTEKFTWKTPDLVGLRIFMSDKLSWSEDETDRHLLPVMKELSEKKSAQTRIDGYFTVRYEDNKRAARFTSKRLMEATKALKRKRHQGLDVELDVKAMLENAPKDFGIVFPNPKQSLLFVLEQNDQGVNQALVNVVKQRRKLEIERMNNEEVEEEEEGKKKMLLILMKKKERQIVCMKYLESLMTKILNTRAFS